MERIFATYLIETPYEVEQAAAVLAGEQSSGTFVSVPGETEELRARFAARVEHIELLDEVPTPSMPGDFLPGKIYKQAKVIVSWSVENFEYNIPALISTLQGNLYELRQFTGLKLDDFELPNSYREHFRGPKFGLRGTKELAGVGPKRPMVGTIIKPSVGLTPDYTADLVRTLAEAGIDFIKDDELLTSSANSPFAERVEKVMRVINEHADKTGKKIMYAFNITGDCRTMQTNYETVVNAGGTCAMVSVNSVGWAATKQICNWGGLSIHGHRNGWGMLNRHPFLGINFPAYNKIWRLAGVDQMHVNGIKNKFWESDDSVVRSIKSCHKPFLNSESVLPVVSSGQWGGQAFETYERTKSTDLLYMAGGGIMAHPSGPVGGVSALRQAWKAAVSGMTLEQAAQEYKEFGESVLKFGRKEVNAQ
ncbi:ribulose-bisphosphate carboxylase large subunit family protein [Aestuariibaculum lutulentum]|uniref:Ribulose-bisphosphate carboxylase large subunit family protein n=1 Tax=Aestuariibaculum lutulentum TaxID=2920935 RepID=A0ABS9RKL3_9FLAO|nr:ribulose-bisphosphate carboxylase large subunit family protein [Aestuariibaculum lutulentum]MCH4553500.1 ribulose-bisphosphate carboxylase large subunit family protein [Aestuariibaculum lutulentum]